MSVICMLPQGGGKVEQQDINYLMLYDAGDECVEVTGGWIPNKQEIYYSEHTKGAEYITLRAGTHGGYAETATNNELDIRTYDAIVVRANVTIGTVPTDASERASRISIGKASDYYVGPTAGEIPMQTEAGSKNCVYIGYVNTNEQVRIALQLASKATNNVLNVYQVALLRMDNWQTWLNHAGLIASNYDSLDAVIADSSALTTLMTNEAAVNYMLYHCTGTLMAAVIQSPTALRIVAESPFYKKITENVHWCKFLQMVGVPRKFGVRWSKTQSNTNLTRLYDAAGKTFNPSVGSSIAGRSDFDNEPIYKDIKLCNVVNGKVSAYFGEANFSRTPAIGDVMVEIPKFYYKIEDNANYRDFLISDKPLDGFQISPRHAPCDQYPEGLDKFYISAYTLNNNYRSVSGNQSVVMINHTEARNGCKNRGTGYYQYDFSSHWTIALLYLIEVANWNSQDSIGSGSTGGLNAQQDTGTTDSVTGHTGRATTYSIETQCCVKYRHMENLWGNLWTWCDGANFYDDNIYICMDPIHYADNTAENYIKLSYLKTKNNGYQKALGLDTRYPWAQVCTDATGSDGTYISDGYTYSTGWRSLMTSGSYQDGREIGMFQCNTINTPQAVYTMVGCRLIMLPPND